MKKFISFIIFLFSIFFIGNVSVYAANNPYLISAHDISPDTYVIGTHMFDENRTYLSTEDMMWAARTIEDAESKEDMVVYYKNYNGEWQNGRTGENITVPSTFKIEEYNGEKAKAVLISTVMEEVDCSGATCYSSIHEDDYNEAGIMLKSDGTKTNYEYEIRFDAHNFVDGKYNFDLTCHKYDIVDNEFIPSPYNIGPIPDTINILNGGFTLPVNIDATDLGEYVSCAYELEKDEEIYESGFFVTNSDEEPMLNAFAMEMTANEVNGEGIGFYPIFRDYTNTNYFYDIYSSVSEINEFALMFNTRFIEEGDYNIEIFATKDGEEINVDYDEVFTISEEVDPAYILANAKHYLTFDEPLSVGEYGFDIILTDVNDEMVTTEYVYLTVTDEKTMDIIEVWGEPEEWYDIDNFTFDSLKKRKFHMTIDTENIPEGVYAIKAELNYDDAVIPPNFNLKAYQNIEIIKPYEVDYFDYYFEVSKGAKIGNYTVNLTLHEINEDGYPMETPIARTSFRFAVAAKSPVLNYKTLSGDELSADYDIGINFDNYSENEMDAWELYVNKEIDGADYIEIDEERYYLYSENEINDVSDIEIKNGETLKFVSRGYTNYSGIYQTYKIYTEWSDIIEITYGDGFPTE